MIQTPIAVTSLSACLVVSDLKAAAAWWRLAFGFEPAKSLDMPESGMRIVFMETGGSMLELVQPNAFEPYVRPGPPGYLNRQGVSQVSIRVASLATAFETAKLLGLSVEWPPTESQPLALRAFMLRDPDGNLVEVIEHFSMQA
jgi:catechol 2,3-dioxygenase-like lactoylglutathione lyase family enzyme